MRAPRSSDAERPESRAVICAAAAASSSCASPSGRPCRRRPGHALTPRRRVPGPSPDWTPPPSRRHAGTCRARAAGTMPAAASVTSISRKLISRPARLAGRDHAGMRCRSAPARARCRRSDRRGRRTPAARAPGRASAATVRVLSARPHSPAGMMSSRAASSGGLAADSSAAPATSNHSAGVRCVRRSPESAAAAAPR